MTESHTNIVYVKRVQVTDPWNDGETYWIDCGDEQDEAWKARVREDSIPDYCTVVGGPKLFRRAITITDREMP